MRRHALLERADVLAALDAYAASEAQLRLELAKQWPDLHLGNGYQFDQGQNKWGLALALDLPVMNRNEGPIAEAVAARGEAAARFSALQAQVIGELDQASLERDGAREQLRRADAVVAEQRRAWQRARAARAEGATDLPAEVAAEIEFRLSETLRLDAQLALERARANLEAAATGAALRRRCGRPIAARSARRHDAVMRRFEASALLLLVAFAAAPAVGDPLVFDAEQRDRMALATAPLAPGADDGAVDASGRVLDPQPLIDAALARGIANSVAERSARELVRVRRLNRGAENASARELEVAEDADRQARIGADAARGALLRRPGASNSPAARTSACW